MNIDIYPISRPEIDMENTLARFEDGLFFYKLINKEDLIAGQLVTVVPITQTQLDSIGRLGNIYGLCPVLRIKGVTDNKIYFEYHYPERSEKLLVMDQQSVIAKTKIRTDPKLDTLIIMCLVYRLHECPKCKFPMFTMDTINWKIHIKECPCNLEENSELVKQLFSKVQPC